MKKGIDYAFIRMIIGYVIMAIVLLLTISKVIKKLFGNTSIGQQLISTGDAKQKEETEGYKEQLKKEGWSDVQLTKLEDIATNIAAAFLTNYSWIDMSGWFKTKNLDEAIRQLNRIGSKNEYNVIKGMYKRKTKIVETIGIDVEVQAGRDLSQDIINYMSDKQLKEIPYFILQ